MRLPILDSGHPLRIKALFSLIRVISKHPPPDVVKTLMYRPEFLPLGPMFQAAMRGESEWSIGERELMAAHVSKTNECEF